MRFAIFFVTLQRKAADDSFEHQDLYIALRTLPPKERSSCGCGERMRLFPNILCNGDDIINLRLLQSVC